VTQRIRVTGDINACTASAIPLRITIELSPRSVANRRVAHGALLVSVVTVVRLDGRRIEVTHRRTFSLTVPLSRLTRGMHRLTFETTSSGSTIHGSRVTRTVRFSRCAPVASFTG
jgi:hypothetical protein